LKTATLSYIQTAIFFSKYTMFRIFVNTGFAVVAVGSAAAGRYTWRFWHRRQKRIIDELEYDRQTMALPTIEEWKAL